MESNIGLFIAYIVSLLLMIGVPIALAIIVIRRFKVSWLVIVTGVVTYIVSQVIHMPVLQKVSALFNNGTLPVPSTEWIPLFNAVVLGFLAALFEESVRYFGFLVMKKKTKKIESAVGLGIGHGGIEAIGYAVWPFFPLYSGLLISFLYILFYNPGSQLAQGISSDQVQYVLAQISQFWTNPWYLGFLPGVERLIAISTQIILSVFVWKAIKNNNFGWFALAFVYHMLVDGIAVYLQYSNWNSWAIEGVLAIFMLANIYLIYYFWKEEFLKEEDEDDEEDDDEDDDDEDEEDEDEDEEGLENDDQVDEEIVEDKETGDDKEEDEKEK